MKRFLVYGSLVLLLSSFLAGELALKWLLESPGGVSWLLGSVSRHTPVTMTAGTITGGLGSALRLEGFSVRWPDGELAVADLRLRCQPLLVMSGSLAIQELSLKGVRFRDLAPPKSSRPEFVWPRITAVPAWVSAWIDHLRIEDFSYQDHDLPPVSLPAVSATLAWRDSRLSVTGLSLNTTHGLVSGTLTAGFDRASLNSALAFEPLRPLVGCTRIEVRTRLQHGRSPEQLAGDITVAGLSGKTARYTLAGDLGLTRNELNLHGLTLSGAGRRGTLQIAGTLPLTGEARLRLRASGLELTQEAGGPMALSGSLDLSGNPERYTGQFNLATSGKGWRKTGLSGRLQGNSKAADLTGITAALLNGTIRGDLRINWRDDLAVKAALQGRGLDPSGLDPAWNGVLNFDLDSTASWAGGQLRQGEAHGRLRESRLRGKALAGEISATLSKDDLRIKRLFLTGSGFDIHAAGILSQRLDLSANISDLSGLVPHTRGTLALKGWGRYAAGNASGEVSGRGRDLDAEGIHIASASLNARLAQGQARALEASAELNGVLYRGVRAGNATLKIAGSRERHQLDLALRSDGAAIAGRVSGAYADRVWKGELSGFSGHDQVGPWRLAAPASLTISSRDITITPLVLTGTASERIDLAGRLKLHPLQGAANANWSSIDLARANQWLRDTRLTGLSSGSLRLGLPGSDRLSMSGKASASGTVTMGARVATIHKAQLELEAGDRGTAATLDFLTAEGISATGRFTSPAPAALAIPSSGELRAAWQGLDPALSRPWLPRGVDLQGRLSGDISGKLLPERRFDLKGTVNLADGKGSWRGDGHELTASVRTAGLTWEWRNTTLSGALAMSLANSGEIQGTFQLPLPARFEPVPDPAGQVRGTLSGNFHEKGVLIAMFPGLFQETKGHLKVDLRAGGTWQAPTLTGTMGLDQAGGYLPAAGIRLADVQLKARLEGNRMQIEAFRATSGSGTLEGTAEISFTGNKLASYRGALRGERFQAVHLPELQLTVTPDLTFEGNPDRFSARGQVRIPEMLVVSLNSSTMVKPSRDTVVAGRQARAAKTVGTPLDLQLQLLLGEQVVVRTEGLDARLEGGINLRMTGPAAATGSGEIRVVKGDYNIYGVKLGIRRGRAIFTGGPVQRPTLDILALRTVDEVKAGVTVTGTPEAPVIKLYSEPTLPDTDILSYIVLGHKMGESGQNNAMLIQAASLLVTPKQSAGLQDQLKQMVGLDTLTYARDKDRNTGYKAIEPNLRSNSQNSRENGSVSQSLLLLGKYLTPQLYVSYGQSLFDESQQIRARYSFSKHWEVETKVSSDASGGDLFYRIEFD